MVPRIELRLTSGTGPLQKQKKPMSRLFPKLGVGACRRQRIGSVRDVWRIICHAPGPDLSSRISEVAAGLADLFANGYGTCHMLGNRAS